MPKSIGIDLGTTNSVTACETRTNDVQIILTSQRERALKSVVGVHKKTNEILIGTQAVNQAATNPVDTIFSIKRMMGLFHGEPMTAVLRQKYQHRIVKPPDGDDARVQLGTTVYTPVEISAMILRRIKETTEKQLGEPVTHAVITVPAYFSNNQRLATRTAGELAGLRVKKIIDEPTAAAIAFGVNLVPGRSATVLVYDLGGGTFDISMLFVVGELFNTLGIEGDKWLGGDDFDHAIVRHVVQQIKAKHGVDPSTDGTFMHLLRQAAEKAKVAVSEQSSEQIMMSSVFSLKDGARGDVDVELTRTQFENLVVSDQPLRMDGDPETLRAWCESLQINAEYSDRGAEFADTVKNRVKKTILLTRKAMQDAALSREQIDHVLLVGGSTAIPLVQQLLEAEFGAAKIMRNIDAMECVAQGAAIAARRIQELICPHLVTTAEGETTPCLEPNALEATICRNPLCGGALIAELRCPDCDRSNPMEAEVCAGCGHAFRIVRIEQVTAKPIGLHSAGGGYEVIVPKGTNYPTLVAVVRTFRTATDAKRAVRVPLYHAEVNEFDPKDDNQWIGAADIVLAGRHVPAGTAVDVSVSMDASGCLDIAAGIVGDGTPSRMFINPTIGGSGKRSAADEADDDQTFQPTWRSNLSWSMKAADIAMAQYEWFFDDHRTTQLLADLNAKAKQALSDGDEAAGRALETQIDEKLDAQWSGLLMALLRGEMAARFSSAEPAVSSRISSVIKQICDLIRTQGADVAVARQKVPGLLDELRALIRQTQQTTRASSGDTLLEKK
jgi:molecular chaperone DnaK